MNGKQAPLIFMKVGNHAGETWDVAGVSAATPARAFWGISQVINA